MKKIIIWALVFMALFPFFRYAANEVYLLTIAKRTMPATTAQQKHIDEAEKDYLSDFSSSKEKEMLKFKKIAQDPNRPFPERKAALKIMKEKEKEIQKETGLIRAKKTVRGWVQSIPGFFSTSSHGKDTRPLSGIYKLPADGTIVSTTIDGRELNLKKGDRFQLTQMGQADRYAFVNHNIPSYEINKRSITMRTVSDGKIELMSTSKKLTIQAQIFR
ncbi:MAG: hypothetical protein A3A94_00905 [Candidatus Portnoybacteria bacterium RIFCSPLOWO2_01_FULL_43_11]|uniref:Uncharacterized protein n=3 Tax=Candidatus Portnoyibacteriota TaxID=1817913 RepID=A0A1G2FQC5_9BACT|nr:MAG: hypothetical protein A3D38_01195 [Candidatus Portnoybacteria bacterium RIFCSPHIGHO2_02_FULL_40_23]OGZ37739.1 MAG: hypothetical protein A3E90_02800 [Candidatus Portnoybacteria bacterium RIFCSPHIGHO2_12_FULL_40_11]OGZ38641.1 MAG: hypothetical protein A3A94_00905 [Candidatus Portnoybacteria bacterium RIFCSPLOWO2_01_FULL_43_11]OGZ40284.1 MAG: hypothetical protein A3I20_02130 [Candidatus Portnoybacteria bacterium RIFCSPLOWO2_02_FULL_40_15]